MPEFSSSPGAGQRAQALVLIAEDEPEIAEILTAYLARSGLRSGHAADQHPEFDLDARRMRCDPVRIRQALLENARRHAVPGAIRIGTCVEQGMCRLRVEDDGPGIPADFAPHVFQAFRRVDESQPGGSGLGLAVVAAIAHAHGGEAVCVPTGAGGTRFEVQWPDNLVPAPENERFPVH